MNKFPDSEMKDGDTAIPHGHYSGIGDALEASLEAGIFDGKKDRLQEAAEFASYVDGQIPELEQRMSEPDYRKTRRLSQLARQINQSAAPENSNGHSKIDFRKRLMKILGETLRLMPDHTIFYLNFFLLNKGE